MKRALVLCLLAACGEVNGEASPDASPDAPPIDGTPDAFVGCRTDEFTGTTLAAGWDDDAVGAAPAIALGTGVLTITDAATAATVTSPVASWVYDLDGDKGNQMRWAPEPIGNRDFVLEVAFGWNSQAAELTLAGVAVVDGEDHIEAFVGVEDGHASASAAQGAPTGRLRGPGDEADQSWAGTQAISAASHTMAIVRTGNRLGIRDGGRDGDEKIFRNVANLDLKGVSIVTVKHKNPAGTVFDFGEATFERVSLCFE